MGVAYYAAFAVLKFLPGISCFLKDAYCKNNMMVVQFGQVVAKSKSL